MYIHTLNCFKSKRYKQIFTVIQFLHRSIFKLITIKILDFDHK